MNWMNLHPTYQLAAGHMTDELAFKGYSPQATPQPPPRHTGFTLGRVSTLPPRPGGRCRGRPALGSVPAFVMLERHFPKVPVN